ncbi:hypothetical protein THIOM_004817 [Candidatus Thiomargarita nelsonii]|uniref:Uncharacterized protein n=1 Tax=Candidatus Thiomargarita nelsonii TaxID=1003181 RepID=A0A176RUY0_9GAMM|nr:hypothetical protein THIOM_004817 [Candidatus Thiomargarita nelsonii]
MNLRIHHHQLATTEKDSSLTFNLHRRIRHRDRRRTLNLNPLPARNVSTIYRDLSAHQPESFSGLNFKLATRNRNRGRWRIII